MKILSLLTFLFTLNLFATAIYAPITSIDKKNHRISVITKTPVEPGMSALVIHLINKQHSTVLYRARVRSYNENNNSALLDLFEFTLLQNNALPKGEYTLQKGDVVEFAFTYDRGVLIAPSEEIYYDITKKITLQWVHPDLFATVLSYHGHPTPQKSDFLEMAEGLNVGLLFIYLDNKLFTLDSKTFAILHIDDAPAMRGTTQLPFYSRIHNIEAAWFGKGSSYMEKYAPHYYALLVEYNPKNEALYNIVKKHNYTNLLSEFTIGKE